MLCENCGQRRARLRVPQIGPDGVGERLLCLSCGEAYTVEPMEKTDAREGDIHLRLLLMPEELVTGAERRLTFTRWSLCPDCGGDGDAACPRCEGAGRVSETVAIQIKAPAGLGLTDRPKILRLRGQGDARLGDGRRGHVLLHVAGAFEYAL